MLCTTSLSSIHHHHTYLPTYTPTSTTGLGQVLNVLMRWGALQPGDYVVAGQEYTRVKKIMDDQGKTLTQGLPSMPVKLLGFKELPAPGEELIVVKSEERAKAVADARKAAAEQASLEVGR